MLPKENYYSKEMFEAESEKLSENSWWFICHMSELGNDLDYVTSTIFDSHVIVQNCAGEIVGFENICAHRFYKIRSEKKGNGKLKCSAHGWLYDREGCAVGIPSRNEIFDNLENGELRLKKIDIGICGKFVFAKLKSSFSVSLKEYLGDFFAVLENVSEVMDKPFLEKNYECDCNWKLMYEVSLDEYHVSEIHPDSFGRLWGHFKITDENHEYHYSKAHSAFLFNKKNLNHRFDAFAGKDNLLAKCASDDYKIFHIFPNLTVTPFSNGVAVILIDPVSPSECIMRVGIYGYKGKEFKNIKILEKFYDNLVTQDILASEHQQLCLKQRWKQDILSVKEIRINHFRKGCESALNKV